MRLVAPPTHLGEDQWPVPSAVRVNTGDDPAEFVILVDCGDGTPLYPYATLQVYLWTKRRTRKVVDGAYNLTFEQARRSLAERAGLLSTTTAAVEVIVVRAPDNSNDYAIFVEGTRRPDGRADGVRVITHDIDLGATKITPAWVEHQLQRVDALSPAAARHARDAVIAYVDDIEVHDEPADDKVEPADGTDAAGHEAKAGEA